MHTPPIRRLFLALSALLASGCMVELGEGDVKPFGVDRTFHVTDTPLTECPLGQLDRQAEDGSDSTFLFAPVGDACMVDITVSNAVLVPEEQVASRAEKLSRRGDVGAIRALDLVLNYVILEDGEGAALPLERLREVVLYVDDQVVWRERQVATMAAAPDVRATMPETLVERFVEALRERRELRGDLRVQLVVEDFARVVPTDLRIAAELQPVVMVDGLDAKL